LIAGLLARPMSRGYWPGGQTPCPIGVGNDRYHWPSAFVLVTVAAAPADRRLPRHLMPAFSDPQPIPAPSSIAISVPSQPWCRYRPTRCGPLLNIERSLRPCRAAPRRHAKRPAAAAGRLGCCGQASWPRDRTRIRTSRTRVRNQRRTTGAVTGFCDRRGRGTSARRRSRLRRPVRGRRREHLTWIHRAHMWHDALTLVRYSFLPLGLAPIR
jgi:hypothetical protein